MRGQSLGPASEPLGWSLGLATGSGWTVSVEVVCAEAVGVPSSPTVTVGDALAPVLSVNGT